MEIFDVEGRQQLPTSNILEDENALAELFEKSVVIHGNKSTHNEVYYPPESRPDQELIERSNKNRPKEYAYDKNRNMCFGTGFEEGEDSSGYSIHWYEELPYYLSDEYTGELHIDDYHENSYIYVDEKQMLFYVRNGHAEPIKINNIEPFIIFVFHDLHK